MAKSTTVNRTPAPAAAETESPWPMTAADLSAKDAATVWGKLLIAAAERFHGPDFEVTLDERHTVWVKRADGTRSVGVSQWMLRRFTVDEILARTEAKLSGRAPAL